MKAWSFLDFHFAAFHASTFEQAEERISELEERKIEIIESEEKKKE